MKHIELFTPWRESAESLRQRTVGRDAITQLLANGLQTLTIGGMPLPVYLFGPRGVGKSHVVALLRDLATQRGISVSFIPEDIPAIRTAADLLNRTNAAPSNTPSWERWQAPLLAADIATEGRKLVVIEGLDRRLAELDLTERQRLRAAWSQTPATWVVGTGVELGTALTDISQPFYGWFDAEALSLLTDEEAENLLDRLVPEETRTRPHWIGRKVALIALAGGSPRVLLTLAENCALPEAPEAATAALLAAVDRFTPHYQLRFRDLAQQAQRIVDLLAAAPRELSPGELANYLATTPPVMATQCRRLAEDGVLIRREDDSRSTWYHIADPLFRYWLEYRTSNWEETRVWLATTLLQSVFTSTADVHQNAHKTPGLRYFQGDTVPPERRHALVAQLREVSLGRLHPELAPLRDRL